MEEICEFVLYVQFEWSEIFKRMKTQESHLKLKGMKVVEKKGLLKR